ncbi:tRNA (5-methylaminomethyl-2-thiouridine)(34)-methyltransferase MnmD [Paraflavitalea sp. CAU 1676]|uniref:tRNA (5-methylaminomethyl-2-thiouridine)(34)-methyltransferase MnmD n=1 Tax=Paraflavitalea sp. CAU 1676 TaxID=3032598 RepID=UPI0023DA8E9A|nr:tRNA (5-methylaminomethyl-2-thiouridine)(34)-methyltransferase MnmD [Paraflavitalea sp. CAU 1676]MDF2186860.1 tRNA (5-methylaminomethyl-2-thiouridine)(34)-methyltransferase MnmD [Paraflavitalea sp. CAU 1676]
MITADGSATIAIPDMQVTYHSKHGAVQESEHVFLAAGLTPLLRQHTTLRIFEMGFGTGLNALLTLIQAASQQQMIHYQSVEAYPLEPAITDQLNYIEQLQRPDLTDEFHQLHTSPWGQSTTITPWFTLVKFHTSLFDLPPIEPVHLIYYDAFAPGAQPELWTTDAFAQLFNLLLPGGVLVTYCSKGDVRRAMQAAGFVVEKIPGPPGKREMVRAHRPIPEK